MKSEHRIGWETLEAYTQKRHKERGLDREGA